MYPILNKIYRKTGSILHIFPFLISPLKPILTFFGVKDGKIEATALKRIADSLNNLINTYVAWADTVGQDYSISNFIKWLKNSQGEIVATELRMYALKAATLALNMVFAMFASWAISAGMNAFINWMKNAKTHSEQLISTMEDAHDAAEEAQQDVDDIQQKLDDLDQKIKDLGAEKIEDIVDPQEKAKIQEINNLLETQLRLKKQIADDENNKANKAASDVFNDKSEVITSNEAPFSYVEADPNGIGVTVTPSKNVTRTEALREHTARVNELSDAYVKLMSDENATDEERAQAKKNLEDEIGLTNDAGTKVSELADMYEADASKYGDVSAEVQECTDSMQGASDALERANNLLNGTTSVENTNLDAFKSKFKDVIEEIDNGYLSMREAIAQYKELSPLQAFGSMTGEAIINIDSDTAHQTEAEAAALAKLHEIADANNISFKDLISAFEQLGIVATSDTSGIANYATQLEETMKAIDSLQSSYKSCSSAVEEYNKYGYLSTDTMQSLLQMDTEYLNCLDLKDGKLQINKQRYAELLAAQYAQAEMEAIEQAITELNTIAKEDSAEKTESLTTATEEEKNKLIALCPALKDATTGTGELAAALAAAQGAADGDNADEIQAKIDSVMNALNTKLTLLHDNMSAAINNGNALSNQLGGFSNSTKSASKSVSDAASAFDTLSKAMKEYNQYGYICADTMKSLAGLEDKYTACLTKQNGKLVLNTAQFRKFIKAQLEEANASNDGGKSASELNKILDWLNSSVDSETISFEQLTDAIKGYGSAMDEAKEKTDAIKSAFSDLYSLAQNKKDVNNPFGVFDADTVEKQYQAMKDIADNTDLFKSDAYNPETGEVDFNSQAFKDAFVASLEKMASTAEETGGAGAKALASAWNKAAEDIKKNRITISEYINGLGSSLEYANNQIDKFQSGFSDISDIVKEYNSYGSLSIDNYQKLMKLDDDYLQCLKLEGNQLKFNEGQYKELLEKKLEDMAIEYEKADSTKELAKRIRELLDALRNSKTGFNDAAEAAKNFETTLSNIKTILSSLLDLFNSGASKKSNDLKIWGDAINDVIDERIKKIEKQEEALDKENEAEERAIELVKAQDALARAQTQHTARVYGSNGYEWEANSADVREAQQNIDDKRREWRNADAKQALEDEKKALNDLKDEYAKVIELIGMSLDDYNKKMKYTAQIQAMTLQQMSDSLAGYKDSVLANMKVVAAGTNMSNAISNLEKLISTLETLNQIYNYVASGGQDVSGGDIKGLVTNYTRLVDLIAEKGFKEAFTEVLNGFQLDVKKILFADNSGIVSLFQKAYGVITTETTKLFGSGGIAEIAQKGIQALTGSGGILGKIGTSLGSLFSGEALAGGAITIGGTTLSIPIVGAIAAAVGLSINNGVQEISQAMSKNRELWADDSKSTSEKILGSIGNILYGLTPIKGWDLSMQYAKKAAEGEGIWDKISNGFKSVYYGCGLGVVLDNLWKTVKKILHIKEDEKKDADSETTTEDASSNKNLSINGTKTTTKTKVPTTTDPTTKLEEKKITGPSTLNWITNPLGSGVDTLTGYDYSEDADNSFFQELAHTVSHPIETIVDGVVGVGKWIGGLFSKKKHATGLKSAKSSHLANVDEQGSELIVRQPASGRYTYLETGDGVVPADITSKLFEMGGNSDAWFQNQIAKYGSATSGIQTKNIDNRQISIGDVNINNPVGDENALARALVQRLPSAIDQQLNKR